MGLRVIPLTEIGDENHVDAIYRAGRNAQLATGAQLGNHGMSAFAATDDRVHRACLDAQGAPDAVLRINAGNVPLDRGAASGVNGLRGFIQQGRKGSNGGLAARWAAVQVRFVVRQGLGVGQAAFKPALGALGLGQ